MIIALIVAFGGAGAAARFVVDGLIRFLWATKFPIGTVTVNLSGSLLMGFLAGAALSGAIGGPVLEAATIGFCSGYTTFSTAMVDTVRLVQTGDYWMAMLNALGTGILVVAAVASGLLLAILIL